MKRRTRTEKRAPIFDIPLESTSLAKRTESTGIRRFAQNGAKSVAGFVLVGVGLAVGIATAVNAVAYARDTAIPTSEELIEAAHDAPQYSPNGFFKTNIYDNFGSSESEEHFSTGGVLLGTHSSYTCRVEEEGSSRRIVHSLIETPTQFRISRGEIDEQIMADVQGDGLVDYISIEDENGFREFGRDQDFTANEDLFEDADRKVRKYSGSCPL